MAKIEMDVDTLTEILCTVDGNQSLGAGALARKIMKHIEQQKHQGLNGKILELAEKIGGQYPPRLKGEDTVLEFSNELLKMALPKFEKTGEMHDAVRKMMKHHKLTVHGDGVVESDIIYAVLNVVNKRMF